jgi:hypothetical protein
MKKICVNINHNYVKISNNMHVSVIGKTIQLIETTTGNVINEMKLERDVIAFHFGHNRLVFVSKFEAGKYHLSIWKVESSLILTHIEDLPIEDYDRHVSQKSLQVDENFIALRSPNGHGDTTFNLISLKTFQVERSLSSFHECYYDGGYLFIMKENQNFVRMLDVASGTFLRDMPIEPSSYGYISRVNSNYVVTSAIMRSRPKSKLHVYDLKCLKETDSDPTHLLLTTIEVEGEVVGMRMNETRIVFLTGKNMFVVGLKPIDRLRCPESC